MKRAFQRTFAALAMTVLSTVNVASEAVAFEFGQKEVEQERFVAIAVPRAYGHSLIVLQQISNTTPCWSESGNNPIEVDPLLLNFDFTGICGRATDSNGYSVRMGGEDLALSHSLSVRGVGDEILLVATSRDNPYNEPIVIGRTNGMSNGFVKIVLEPGWRFAKRTYQDKTLGHIYFTHDYSASAYSQMVNPTQTDGRTESSTDKPTENAGSDRRIYNRRSNRNSNRLDNRTENKTENKTENTTDPIDNGRFNRNYNRSDNKTENKTENTANRIPDNATENKTENTANSTPDNATENTTSKPRSYRNFDRTENDADSTAEKTAEKTAENTISNPVDNRPSNRLYRRISNRNSKQFFNRYYDRDL